MKPDILKLFYYFIEERHSIYKLKKVGLPRSWTDDPILDSVKFTNIFPSLDTTSIQVHSLIKKHHRPRSRPITLFNVIAFRFFNWKPTYEHVFNGWCTKYDSRISYESLKYRVSTGKKIFTGAYVNSIAFNSSSDYSRMIEALSYAWKQKNLFDHILGNQNDIPVKNALIEITRIDLVGPFMAMMILNDLIHTGIYKLCDSEKWIWLGPGSVRGINRLHDRSPGYGKRSWPKMDQFSSELIELKSLIKKNTKMPPMKLRDIEHSLCEFDKYYRIKFEDAKPWRLYKNET